MTPHATVAVANGGVSARKAARHLSFLQLGSCVASHGGSLKFGTVCVLLPVVTANPRKVRVEDNRGLKIEVKFDKLKDAKPYFTLDRKLRTAMTPFLVGDNLIGDPSSFFLLCQRPY